MLRIASAGHHRCGVEPWLAKPRQSVRRPCVRRRSAVRAAAVCIAALLIAIVRGVSHIASVALAAALN